MTKKVSDYAFKASQVAGSCRLEGISVSARSQARMESIIEGKKDGEAIKERLVRQYRRKNAATLSAAME